MAFLSSAVHPQWAAGDSIGLYRLRPVHRLYLAGNHAARDTAGCRRRGVIQRSAALSSHHFDRHHHRQSMDRDLVDYACGNRYRGDAFQRGRAFDFPPAAFNFSLGFSLVWEPPRASAFTTIWAITTSATSATR